MAKGKFVVTSPSLKTVIPDNTRLRVSEACAEENVRQVWTRGEDANGDALPSHIDLDDTGDLKTSITATADGYQFDAEHAAHVEKNYPFAGLNDRSLQEVKPTLQDIIDEAGDSILSQGES